MKLVGLHLLAYGPFTNVELDLLPEGMHVVYGKNEAGKSTALRAITGLLYGIAKNTPDAHLHKMPDLRVGGRFRVSGGETVYLVRRKGKDHTLLDREGRPVDEAVLGRLLGGVSEEQFLSMFGLDHETLRRGGDALLHGEGNVGESLYGAAVAGGEVHKVLRELHAEAEALFTPKAHTRPLNEALKAWSEAQRRARDGSMSPESIVEQEKNLEELRRDRAACEADRQRLLVERGKLERVLRALPIVARKKAFDERRSRMGSVLRLTADSSSNRIEATRLAEAAASEIGELERRLSDLQARRSSLVVPESLVRHESVPLDLANRLGSHRKAIEDLPRIQAEVEGLDAEARTILRETGRTARLDQVEGWRIDTVTQAGIRKLVLEKSAFAQAKHRTQKALVERRARLAAVSAKRNAMPALPDVRALKKATLRAERDGGLDERLARLLAQAARLEQRARAELSALGLAELSLEAAAGLPAPSQETIERFGREWAALEREQEVLQEQTTDLEAESVELAREIEALELVGKVPTEPDLAGRERRNDLWRRIKKTLDAGPHEKSATKKTDRVALASSFEREMALVDDIADRLRREAERVGRHAALVAEREVTSARRANLAEKKEELRICRREQASEWSAVWGKLGIEPGPPAEMKPWLAAHAALLRTADELRVVLADASATREAIESHREPIWRLLDPHLPPPDGVRLASVLDRAHELIETSEAAGVELRQAEHDIAEIQAQIVILTAEEDEHLEAETKIEEGWRRALEPLGIAVQATPDEVTTTIDLLTRLFHKIDQAEKARRRIAAIERDARVFAGDVETLAREHCEDLLGSRSDVAAGEILERHRRGHEDLVERREIDRQLGEVTQMLDVHRRRLSAAESRLGDLMKGAAVETLEALAEAERRSEEVRELDRQLERLDNELLEIGIGSTGLPAEFESWDSDVASAKLEEVAADIEQLHTQALAFEGRIAGNLAGRKDLEDPKTRAADAAFDAEAALARVREIAERYVRARVASVVLAREIERYRRENQGPIVTRASELFRRLTLASFSALRTDFDEKDQPILLGVRTDGRDLRVDAMSDGTRDQLYLALRLATLERFGENRDPMPLIVDDILVHFDDDRARAALAVLGDLSQRTQVLFFTHHARLVELAREAIPEARLFVRELSETAAANGAS